jgi:hypothetical protein
MSLELGLGPLPMYHDENMDAPTVSNEKGIKINTLK